MENNSKENKLLKYRPLEKWLIGILIFLSFAFLGFSFYAPILFTQSTNISSHDFTSTGQIGDTIGGIMNPFISTIGVLLTFLAFYIQYRANQFQIEIFKEGIKNDKKNEILKDKIDCYYKLSLLESDLSSILKDVENKCLRFKEFYENEQKSPLNTNLLLRTSSNDYNRILELDRLSIFKAFKYFSGTDKLWVKSFSDLYGLIDFLSGNLKDIYEKYEYHTNDKFSRKKKIVNDLKKFTDDIITIENSLNLALFENNFDKNSTMMLNLLNSYLFEHTKIINENMDKDGNQTTETDLLQIATLLTGFVEKGLDIEQNYDIKQLLLDASNIRKEISTVINYSIQFSETIENQYNVIKLNEEGGIVNKLAKIKSEIQEKLLQNFELLK